MRLIARNFTVLGQAERPGQACPGGAGQDDRPGQACLGGGVARTIVLTRPFQEEGGQADRPEDACLGMI